MQHQDLHSYQPEPVAWTSICSSEKSVGNVLLQLLGGAQAFQLEVCNLWAANLDFLIKLFVFPYFCLFLGGTLSRISACEVCNLWAAFPFPFKTLKLQNGRRPVSTEVGNFGEGGFLIFPVFFSDWFSVGGALWWCQWFSFSDWISDYTATKCISSSMQRTNINNGCLPLLCFASTWYFEIHNLYFVLLYFLLCVLYSILYFVMEG